MEKLAAGGGRNFPSRIGCPEDFAVASPACSAPYCGNGTLAGGVRPTMFAAGNARSSRRNFLQSRSFPRTMRRLRRQPVFGRLLIAFHGLRESGTIKRFTPKGEENA